MDITNKRFFTAALELVLEAKYIKWDLGRMRAMIIRIVASFLAVLATGLIAAPVETSARGGAFAGGHGMSDAPAVGSPTRMTRSGCGERGTT